MDYSLQAQTIGSIGHQRNDSTFSNFSNYSNNNYNNRNSYYDDDGDVPRQDCQKCDKCCACVSAICGRVSVPGTHGALWAVGSLIFWAILWSFASAFPTERQFQLKVGETWEVTLPPLWSRRSFSIQTTTTDPGLQVFEFAPVLQGEDAKCPLPTPDPSKKLQATTSVILQGNQYQYDFYHLNAGSKISLDLFQGKGATNIYLLRGYSALKSLQKDSLNAASSYQDFRAKSILKRYSGPGGETTFTYEVTEPDFYILVYDNAASLPIPSKLMVQLTIQLATHIMPEAKCICDAKATQDGGCIWRLTSERDRRRVQSSCIIVKAVSSIATSTFNASSTSSEDIVQVRLNAKVGSALLTVLAIIPFLIGLLLICREHGSYCFRPQRGMDEDSSANLRKSSPFYNNYQSVSTTDAMERPTTRNQS